MVGSSEDRLEQIRAKLRDGFVPSADAPYIAAEVADALNELGQREEAISVLEEAATTWRAESANVEAESRKRTGGHPAHSDVQVGGILLNNLGVLLAQVGRRAEALSAIEEAVVIYRQLAEQNAAAYTPDLARTLNNYSLRLGELGRRAEALSAIEEAVVIYRQLADPDTGNPAAYLPDLARTLNNYSAALGELGRRAEALSVIEEAIVIYRQLADPDSGNPAAYLPDLAGSLSNLGVRLGELERHEEALAPTQESVTIRRMLADPDTGNPAAYLPDLAGSLSNLGVRLGELGRHEEALSVIEEAVVIYRQLAEQNAAAYTPDLARTLNNYSAALGELGRRAEALSVIEEAVVIYRQLAEQNAAAYTPDLARTLNNYGAALLTANEARRAAEVLRGALEHLGPVLGETHPDLVTARANLAAALHRTGQVDAARDLMTRVLRERDETLGVNDPETERAKRSARLYTAASAVLAVLDEYGDRVGTAFTVSHMTGITAAHVVKGREYLHLVDTSGRTLDGRVIALDTRADIAVLVLDSGASSHLTPANDPKLGERVFVIASNGQISGAEVTSIATTVGSERLVLTPVLGERGLSGAPVIDDAGQVVGLIIAKSPSGELAARASEIRTVLESAAR